MNSENKRIARDAGYTARENNRARTANPFPADEAWACLRGAWYDGWDRAHYDMEGAPFQ